ncbi:uncharacterized protein LOC111064495 isoform X2 [Nilaparvata lugens]|uniref:uncharacterized protein LOC111064495 isoform X2 n=1 Tax=Nilaparvata lugens TaxID=108931 RepID=UPI00193E2111|nr:uncharacterized protein LOC111064495 isoform X2 [Nilaparvata lugens]
MSNFSRKHTISEVTTSVEGEGTPAKVSRNASEELKPMDSDPSVVNNEDDTTIGEEAIQGEGAGLDNPRPSGSLASGPLASDSLASGPLASDSLASGPLALDSLASGSLASGSLASGTHASGPLATGPLASGPLASGTLASGPVASSSLQGLVCHSCYDSLDGRPLFKCGTCANMQMCADCVSSKSHEHVMLWIPSLQALSSSGIFVERLKKQARRQTVTSRSPASALIMPLVDNFNLSLFRGLRTRMTGQTAISCDRIINRKMGNAVAGLTATNCDLTFKHNMRLAVKVENATACHRPVSCIMPTACNHTVTSKESAVPMDAAKGKEDEKEREKMMKKQEKEAKKKERMLLKKQKKREEKKQCKEVMKLLKNVPHPAFRSTYTTDAVDDPTNALMADLNIPLDKKHYFPDNKIKSEGSQPQEEAEQREVVPEWDKIVFGQKIEGSQIEPDVIASLEKILFGKKEAGKNAGAVKVANNNSEAAKVADDNLDTVKVADDNLNATKVAENNSGAVKVASNKNSLTTKVADDNLDAANIADILCALKVADNNSDAAKVASLLTDKLSTTVAQTQFEGNTIPLNVVPEKMVEKEEVVTCSSLPDEHDWAIVDPIPTEEIPK